ncbi:MoaD/ThiS family protein [Polymorphospora rubra]|uniref:Molybdopterin synthase sulfur carrier subunit n=1 Tax=Polymorphospora rubra TaxID=338584 RepID=A0A810MWH8_9ACTN|nr:MoaD/ThiS family protein [Polymorphospora rubra]BCJ65536.1 molybdopterin synthase sulfur carrier subunit [Polymorphospora rubra]
MAGSQLTVRYFAAARAAAGTGEETVEATGSVDELVDVLVAVHGERLAHVLKVASFLVDGTAWHDHQAPLPAGVTVDVLPPFAGG